MSRKTLNAQAIESSKNIHKNASFISRKNTSRKMTALKGLKSMNSVNINSVQDITLNNLNQELAKKLKERLQRFILISMMLFNSHLCEIASKTPHPYHANPLGSTTQILRKFPFIIEPSFFEDKLQNPLNISTKLSPGFLNYSANTFESLEAADLGNSTKINRISLIRSTINNEENNNNDSNLDSPFSNKKLEEPPLLKANPILINNLNMNKNPLEMIQEEMEDKNSIYDLKKFNDTNTRFLKKLESMKESIQCEGAQKQLDEKVSKHSSFNVNVEKPSKILTQEDIENINRLNFGGKSLEMEKIEQLSTKSFEKNDNFLIKNDNSFIKKDSFSIKNDNLLIKTDNFKIKIDNLSFKNDKNNNYSIIDPITAFTLKKPDILRDLSMSLSKEQQYEFKKEDSARDFPKVSSFKELQEIFDLPQKETLKKEDFLEVPKKNISIERAENKKKADIPKVLQRNLNNKQKESKEKSNSQSNFLIIKNF